MAAVSEIKEEEGQWQAKTFFMTILGNTEAGSAVYDRADGQLYVEKRKGKWSLLDLHSQRKIPFKQSYRLHKRKMGICGR